MFSFRSRQRQRGIAALFVFAVVAPIALKAVVVSPTAIFMSSRERFTQLTLYNSASEPEEISIELKYGYPDTDSTGSLVYRLLDTIPEGAPANVGWVTAYPRRITLAPGTRQVVRLTGSPPASLADGEYWGRLVITSNPRAISDATGSDPAVRAGMTLTMRTVIPVLFRRGVVNTAVSVADFDARRTGDSLLAHMTLRRGGNAAFLGNALFEMRDSTSGRVFASWRIPLAIHVAQKRRFVFSIDSTTRGAANAQLRVTLTSQRSDLPASQVLPAPRVTSSAPIRTD